MADLTVYARNKALDALRTPGIYAELFNGDPQGAGTSVQNTVTGSANRTAMAFAAPAAGAMSNSATTTFIAAASAGATVTHLALYDAVTGGNLLASHALTSGNLVVTAGNPVTTNAGGATVSLS